MGKFSIRIFLLVLVYLLSEEVNCAEILFYHNIASYSHRVPTYELALALAKRGHQVTMMSPYRPKDTIEKHPNITDITPKSVEKTMADFLGAELDINIRVNKQFPRMVFQFFEAGLVACEDFLTSPELKEYFQRTKKLDLIFIDNCWAECGAAVAFKYKAKHIFFNTLSHIPNEHDFLGMHGPQSGAIPELELYQPTTLPMGLLDRAFNALISIHFRYTQYEYLQRMDAMVRRSMDGMEKMPNLDDVARNHSLVFYTGDVFTDYTRSQPPNVVNVAGIQCKKDPGQLPVDMLNFINNSTGNVKNEGFVYFSLGSLATSSLLPDHLIKLLLETIVSFPQLKFLWKWNGPLPAKYSENIYFAPWFPQQEVLAHPKIKAFVMQSGRPSTIEGVCHGVPMIGFPVLADQDVITDRMVMVGATIRLELGEMTRDEFKNALNTVVYDEKMRRRVKNIQKIFHDRPSTPLETAVWWTEYALRHEDLNHLRPAGFEQSWWERRLLDIWAMLFATILSALLVLLFVIYKICRVVSTCFGSEFKAKPE